MGFAFTAKDAKILQKRNYAPGQHGQNRVRVSEYGTQLREKQKAKLNYGLQERQFIRYFNQALKTPGVTGDNLLKLLETRLDNAVFRLGFADSRAQGRQLVSHGFFEVNGKKLDIPSYRLKVGEVVKMRLSKQSGKYAHGIKEKLKNFQTQEWLELNSQELSGKILAEPTPEQIGNLINTQLIVEHYSRI